MVMVCSVSSSQKKLIYFTMHQEASVPVPLCSPALFSLSLPFIFLASCLPPHTFYLFFPHPVAPALQGAVVTSVSKAQQCHLVVAVSMCGPGESVW